MEVTGYAENGILITVKARSDPMYPEHLFVSLSRYGLGTAQPPDDSVEVATVEAALELLEEWLRSVIR